MKASIFTRDGKLAGMLVSVLRRRGIETAQPSIRSAYSLDGIAGENRRGRGDSLVLVFIDVELDAPHASGFVRELASALSESQLILIADSSRYAVEAFRVDAAAYLVRPFDRGMLEKAVDRAIGRLRAAGRPAIAVQVEKGRVERFYVDDLTAPTGEPVGFWWIGLHHVRTPFSDFGTRAATQNTGTAGQAPRWAH